MKNSGDKKTDLEGNSRRMQSSRMTGRDRMNREYLYANWRGGNALLGRVAAMVKVGTTRVNLTSQWPDAFLSGNFFIPEFKSFVHWNVEYGDERKTPG